MFGCLKEKLLWTPCYVENSFLQKINVYTTVYVKLVCVWQLDAYTMHIQDLHYKHKVLPNNF